MRYIFVVNPHAGEADLTEKIRASVVRLPAAEDCDVYVTKGPGDATKFVKDWCAMHPDEAARFIACGGDGTVNEVFSGAAGKEHVSVTCYPCGSGNDFVKAFGGAERFLDIPALLRAPCRNGRRPDRGVPDQAHFKAPLPQNSETVYRR